MNAMGLLYATLEIVGANGLPINRLAPLFCAAILKAKEASQ
jgi:hypothetical protein